MDVLSGKPAAPALCWRFKTLNCNNSFRSNSRDQLSCYVRLRHDTPCQTRPRDCGPTNRGGSRPSVAGCGCDPLSQEGETCSNRLAPRAVSFLKTTFDQRPIRPNPTPSDPIRPNLKTNHGLQGKHGKELQGVQLFPFRVSSVLRGSSCASCGYPFWLRLCRAVFSVVPKPRYSRPNRSKPESGPAFMSGKP